MGIGEVTQSEFVGLRVVAGQPIPTTDHLSVVVWEARNGLAVESLLWGGVSESNAAR